MRACGRSRGETGLKGREEELAALLAAALAGDERAYAAFLAAVAGFVRALARRGIARGGVEAEDIVQGTLLAIHLKRHTWRAEAAVLALGGGDRAAQADRRVPPRPPPGGATSARSPRRWRSPRRKASAPARSAGCWTR